MRGAPWRGLLGKSSSFFHIFIQTYFIKKSYPHTPDEGCWLIRLYWGWGALGTLGNIVRKRGCGVCPETQTVAAAAAAAATAAAAAMVAAAATAA
jgi:hypothetical protein